jgi:hypothetical protein
MPTKEYLRGHAAPSGLYALAARVRAAFFAAWERPACPLVLTAFLAAAERSAAVRFLAADFACRDRASCDVAALPSRSRACWLA